MKQLELSKEKHYLNKAKDPDLILDINENVLNEAHSFIKWVGL